MFTGVFQNGLKARHFNESLAQRPSYLMVEVVTRMKCYTKCEENNAKKKTRDLKDRVPSTGILLPTQEGDQAADPDATPQKACQTQFPPRFKHVQLLRVGSRNPKIEKRE